MAIPQGWGALGFTSGRRTYQGNKLVGGVPNSNHLSGSAADFTASMDAIRAQFPGHHIIQEGDHRHVDGLSNVPYFGNQGIAGLQNGVDTSAPQGQPQMARIQPRKPNTLGSSLYPQQGGMDPLAPQHLNDQPMSFAGAQPTAPMQQMAAAPEVAAPKHNNTGKTLGNIAGILGDALSAYGGQKGVFAPFMQQQMQDQSEENRYQQRLAAEIQGRKEVAAAKAAEPPQEFQTADYYNGLDAPRQAAFRSARDAISPIVADIGQPDGSVRRSIIPRSDMGGNTRTIGDKKYYLVNGEWYDNPEGR